MPLSPASTSARLHSLMFLLLSATCLRRTAQRCHESSRHALSLAVPAPSPLCRSRDLPCSSDSLPLLRALYVASSHALPSSCLHSADPPPALHDRIPDYPSIRHHLNHITPQHARSSHVVPAHLSSRCDFSKPSHLRRPHRAFTPILFITFATSQSIPTIFAKLIELSHTS